MISKESKTAKFSGVKMMGVKAYRVEQPVTFDNSKKKGNQKDKYAKGIREEYGLIFRLHN